LQMLLMRLCRQMLAPPQSLQLLLTRLCWQMLAPPQSLQLLLWRLCWQMIVPPQSLHLLLSRLHAAHKAYAGGGELRLGGGGRGGLGHVLGQGHGSESLYRCSTAVTEADELPEKLRKIVLGY